MGSRDHSGEMQLAPIGVSEVSTILRDLQCEFIRTTALLLFCSSKQTGADEQLDHVVTSCHGTFVGVDLRHVLPQRRSKGSLVTHHSAPCLATTADEGNAMRTAPIPIATAELGSDGGVIDGCARVHWRRPAIFP